ICDAVDVISLPGKPADCDAVFIGSIDNRANDFSNTRFVTLRRDQALQLSKPLEALAFHRIGYVVGHFRSARSFLGRISERTYAIELNLLEKFQKLLEVIFGFARKSNNA